MDRNRYPRRYGSSCGQNHKQSASMSAGDNCLCVNQPIALAMSYVKAQPLGELYSPCEGWRRGTIFTLLDKSYCAGGGNRR